jgi:hypothetical protein
MNCTTARAGPRLRQRVHAICKPSWLVNRNSCCEFLFISSWDQGLDIHLTSDFCGGKATRIRSCKRHVSRALLRILQECQHFVHIAQAMNDRGPGGIELWDNHDGFYYDVLHLPNGDRHYLKVRSLVGLIPLLAVETFEQDVVDRLPGFKRRMQWFIDNHPDVRAHFETSQTEKGLRGLLSLVDRGQLERVLRYLLDESEFLSPHGVRAISRFHKDNPYVLHVNGTEHRVDYEPAGSRTALFGENFNWRGPVWFPIDFLLIEALQKFHHFYGDTLTVELPTGSGRQASFVAGCR